MVSGAVDKQAERVLKKADSNGDGVTDFDEFMVWMREGSVGSDTGAVSGSTSAPAWFTSQQFSALDRDGDGQISRSELIISLELHSAVSSAAAEAWADQVLKQFDTSRDGVLDATEFAAFVNARYAKLHKVFDDLDVSKTDCISADDVRTGLQKADVAYLDADVERVLTRMGQKSGAAAAGRGVSFDQFFEASVLLPSLTARELLLTQAGVFPLSSPPPGTTPAMILAAGFVNGAVSRTMTAPTDRLRAVLATGRETSVANAFNNILKQQGVRGFWSSNLANVVQVAPENGIAFLLNDVMRDRVCVDASAPTVSERFLLGSAAGAIAMTAVYPMYVVQNRMAAARPGQYRGMFDCIREVGRGGMGSCYAGYQTSLVRVIPMKGIMLGGYSTLKDMAKDQKTGEISTAMSLACSATSGGLAHAATYPLHLARTVLQQEVEPGGRKYSGFVDVLSERMKTQGIKGCFRGLPIWLCNRVPAVAIEFAVNERALDTFRQFAERNQPASDALR